jgi:hypothetical protein
MMASLGIEAERGSATENTAAAREIDAGLSWRRRRCLAWLERRRRGDDVASQTAMRAELKAA